MKGVNHGRRLVGANSTARQFAEGSGGIRGPFRWTKRTKRFRPGFPKFVSGSLTAILPSQILSTCRQVCLDSTGKPSHPKPSIGSKQWRLFSFHGRNTRPNAGGKKPKGSYASPILTNSSHITPETGIFFFGRKRFTRKVPKPTDILLAIVVPNGTISSVVRTRPEPPIPRNPRPWPSPLSPTSE